MELKTLEKVLADLVANQKIFHDVMTNCGIKVCKQLCADLQIAESYSKEIGFPLDTLGARTAIAIYSNSSGKDRLLKREAAIRKLDDTMLAIMRNFLKE